MTEPATLDHIVVNVRADLDLGEQLFSEMGFQLTPRGRHSLGSLNALSIFQDDYLELLGLPPDRPDVRPELAQAPLGLNGVVFKTSDADKTHAHLASIGIDADPPKSFSRPVTLGDGSQQDAHFRTVTVPPEHFAAGRLYFCEHQNPELVWRPEWQHHANGAGRFLALFIVTTDPDRDATKVASILDGPQVVTTAAAGHAVTLDNGFSLNFLSPDHYQTRFGAHAADIDGRSSALAAVTIAASATDTLPAALAGKPGIYGLNDAANELHVLIRPLNTLVVFTPNAA